MGGRSGSCSARWREQRVDLGGVPQPCRIGNKQQKRQGWRRRCQCHARPCVDVGATRGRVSRGWQRQERQNGGGGGAAATGDRDDVHYGEGEDNNDGGNDEWPRQAGRRRASGAAAPSGGAIFRTLSPPSSN